MGFSYLVADCIVSPLGVGTGVHWESLSKGESGIGLVNRPDITLKNFYGAAVADVVWQTWMQPSLTRLESMIMVALKEVESRCSLSVSSSKTALVFSTTKGNIDLINSPKDREKLKLGVVAHKIATAVGNPNQPYVVSNACISGLSAILLGDVLLKSAGYEQVIVIGADLISEFTVSGFHCLHAISPFPCKPFDEGRMGLSPGEACGVLVLSKSVYSTNPVKLLAGATSNDANHISGPSRTGDGLAIAIQKALKLSGVRAQDIDYVNTHGTATLYNDESESKALAQVGLNLVPANSLKGYFGHTFGAAGVIEAILTAQSIRESQLLASKGYEKHGVSTEMNIVAKGRAQSINHALKTASGFGGCNAALVLSKG